MKWRGALLATVVAVGSACGGGDGPSIDPQASRALDEQVDLVEFAIAAGRYEAARRGLENVRAEVEDHAAQGDIGRFRLPAITEALDRLDEALASASAG